MCDTQLCVNPEHLQLGTMKDNTHDMISKKRDKNSRKTHCKNGHEFNEENTKIRIRNNKQINYSLQDQFYNISCSCI